MLPGDGREGQSQAGSLEWTCSLTMLLGIQGWGGEALNWVGYLEMTFALLADLIFPTRGKRFSETCLFEHGVLLSTDPEEETQSWGQHILLLVCHLKVSK